MSAVTLPPARQATAHVPQPVAADAAAKEIGVGEEPRHTPVAVEERVNPHQTVVGRRQSYDRAHAVLFGRVVEECEALEETVQSFGRGRDVSADLHEPRAQVTGLD